MGRPSPALRRLTSQMDLARNEWLWSCAAAAEEHTWSGWPAYQVGRARRWKIAWQVLAELVDEQAAAERQAGRG